MPKSPDTKGHSKETAIANCPIIGIALKKAVPNIVTAPLAAVAPTLIFVKILPEVLPKFNICSLEYFVAAANLPLKLVALSISFKPLPVRPEPVEVPFALVPFASRVIFEPSVLIRALVATICSLIFAKAIFFCAISASEPNFA